MKQGSTLKLQAARQTVNGVLTFNWYLIAKKLGEPSKMGKRKTAEAGAPIDDAKEWSSIDWTHARQHVRRLQVRIAKAVLEGRWNKVRSLQNLLSNSFYAKLLAVKRVTSNKGKNTPGVDGILWKAEAFSRVDTYVFEQLWRMVKRRHRNKSNGWLAKKYWKASGRKHIFAVVAKTKENLNKVYQVVKIGAIGIRRFIKIKAAANPYLPEFAKYF